MASGTNGVNGVDQKILDRIRKVYELSKDPSNEHEAALAAERVSEMLARYNLTVSEVMNGTADIVEVDHWTISRMDSWYDNLMHACCTLCDVQYIIWSRGRNKSTVFVGYRENVNAALATFNYLHKSLERLEDMHPELVGQSAKRSYWMGATRQIYNMTVAYKDSLKKKDEQIQALVLVTGAAIDKYMKSQGVDEVTLSFTSAIDPYAYRQGQKDASKLNIHGGTQKHLED